MREMEGVGGGGGVDSVRASDQMWKSPWEIEETMMCFFADFSAGNMPPQIS